MFKLKEIKLLFKVLALILDNQIKIMRHLGITGFDSAYGYDDAEQIKLMNQCEDIGNLEE